MHRLIDYPLQQPSTTAALRAKAAQAPEDDAAQIALGLALAGQGCAYEAGHLLRPRRKLWKDHGDAAVGKAALAIHTWYNKRWREFAHLRQAGKDAEALELLGDRAPQFWDHPPMLMHLGSIAATRDDLDLAEHIFRRIHDLAERGLPKMNMQAFIYGAQASLLDVLAKRGKSEEALAQWRLLAHNPGNAMAQQIQGAHLMVAAGAEAEALKQVAAILVTAQKERKGYSRDVRLDFVDKSAEIAILRQHPDWVAMRDDPAGYLKSA